MCIYIRVSIRSSNQDFMVHINKGQFVALIVVLGSRCGTPFMVPWFVENCFGDGEVVTQIRVPGAGIVIKCCSCKVGPLACLRI